MPLNGLNVGKDVSITVVVGGQTQSFSYITSFDANPVTGDLKSQGLDGRNRHAVTHEGWEGEIGFDRDSDAFDKFWAQLEDDYFTGIDSIAGTITETIIEVSGGVTQWRYDGVVFKFKKSGKREGNKLIQGVMGFFAERRINAS